MLTVESNIVSQKSPTLTVPIKSLTVYYSAISLLASKLTISTASMKHVWPLQGQLKTVTENIVAKGISRLIM